MSYPPPPGTIQNAFYMDEIMPPFERRAIKNQKIQKKDQKYYGTIDNQNLWHNTSRNPQKNTDSHKAEQWNKNIEKFNSEQQQKKIEAVQTLRAWSAGRVKKNQSMTITLKLKSNQQLTQLQASKVKDTAIQENQSYRTTAHIMNKSPENMWNHIELHAKKQVQNLFTDYAIKKEIESIDRIKKRLSHDQSMEKKRREIVMRNKSDILNTFKQRVDQHRDQSKKLGYYKGSEVLQQPQQSNPLFLRLSIPKEQYKPDNTQELPELRDFILCQIGAREVLEGPDYVEVLKDTKPALRNLEVDKEKIKIKQAKNSNAFQKYNLNTQVSEKKTTELKFDTVDLNNQEDLTMGRQLMSDLDQFEEFVAKSKRGDIYSQIRQKEDQLLMNEKGLKHISQLKKKSQNYVIAIGNEIRSEKLQ